MVVGGGRGNDSDTFFRVPGGGVIGVDTDEECTPF
jgi:hypothetical protein